MMRMETLSGSPVARPGSGQSKGRAPGGRLSAAKFQALKVRPPIVTVVRCCVAWLRVFAVTTAAARCSGVLPIASEGPRTGSS